VADSKKAIAYYLPEDLIRWVNIQAESERRSRSYIVERALNRERAVLERGARGDAS
jgi:predicted transcriptional regulator